MFIKPILNTYFAFKNIESRVLSLQGGKNEISKEHRFCIGCADFNG